MSNVSHTVRTGKPFATGIGRRLAAVRRHLGLTQSAFAERFGVPRQTYLSWEHERNEPSARLLGQLVEDIGVDGSWLLAGPGDGFQLRDHPIDWERLRHLSIQVAKVAKSARVALRPEQVLDYARIMYLGDPAKEEFALAQLAEILGPLGR
ncbi:MAG: XRE family transcriptional regulator [Brevundimonas sp.]|uniref:helix-turn-helix domain-containing protein n=1 Tax=Brevundimonas sp. TaxID=1871086 RepID=UPI001220B0C1|nr:helix-turn-helix transcriptional regulator [Brevundimonas sp.]RZJ19392.1 MAG: XRE family transcriptional regulator [Brevundimonas sp.]